MGMCQYRYTASELYQRTPPGCAPESCCGALTFPAKDEPELAPVTEWHDGQRVDRLAPTGRFTNRAQHDPHCPAHGGSPEPAPEHVSLTEIEQARAQLLELQQRYDQQPSGTVSPASLSDSQNRVALLVGAYNGQEQPAAIEPAPEPEPETAKEPE